MLYSMPTPDVDALNKAVELFGQLDMAAVNKTFAVIAAIDPIKMNKLVAEAFIAVDNYNKWGTAEAGAKIIKWLDAELA